ncbi:glycosyltransferase [Aliarcobacter cryaerophilus]|uniref:glycosyltransferase n=1 Tax=Aliarcobacter cryaerophilus TaxID=28198 RepID=UPI0008246D0D|nr:glycosyltransferase [Aliarcobacter cryaerophilus]
MSKTLYSTVIYPCDDFDRFIKDYLESVFKQTIQDFDLLLVLDNVEVEKVEEYLSEYNNIDKKVFIRNFKEGFSPIELRKKQIDLAYELEFDTLILSDFDENVAHNRVEEVIKNIDGYAFAFNDFYVVDQDLKKISETSFFQTRKIPNEVTTYKDILEFNFIGLGSIALNLKEFDYKILEFPKEIKALDWYIATRVLLSGVKGISLHNTYANYRQHESSFVGFDFKLNKEKLEQGIAVKLAHYNSLISCSDVFKDLYNEMMELKTYLQDNVIDKYIELVNTKFDTSKFCWWENIKTKKELGI